MGLVVWMEMLSLGCNGKWCHRMLLNRQLDGDGLVGMAIVGGIGLGLAGLAGLIGLAVAKKSA